MTAVHPQGGDALAELVARSRKLGADRTVCNWGGGNTSVKADATDFRGRNARMLWVKGSGSDLASVTERSFTGLYLDELAPLLERERMSDIEMVDYLAHCFSEPGRPRPSIETLLHAFLPYTHIDHTHADAANYFACAANGEQLARECFGDALVWVPYRRPGFGLAREVALAVAARPHARLVILAKHGLITWGETDEECYTRTLDTIAQARDFVEARIGGGEAFGGARINPLQENERRRVAAAVMPTLRGLISSEKRAILCYEDTPDIVGFTGSVDAPRLAQVGAACPDHLVHTKPWPLLVDWTPQQGVDALMESLRQGVADYVEHYRAYLQDNAGQNLDPDAAAPAYRERGAATDPAPRIILIPGVGMITTGKDATMASISAQLYHRAIAVMRGAEACGGFVSLTAEESYAVEYWPLEQYKLQLAPPEREFARTVALVTRAAGDIGAAVCRRLARDGAHIIAADSDLAGAQQVAGSLNTEYGPGRAIALRMDITSTDDVRMAFTTAAQTFGGVDVIAIDAGVASSGPITETSPAEWAKNTSVVAREGFVMLAAQNRGGSIVCIARRNGPAAGRNAASDSIAETAETHIVHRLAEEGAALGIRVNLVNTGAMLYGSHIEASSGQDEQAPTYGTAPVQPEQSSRKGTAHGVTIAPDDIAEAVAFFAAPTRTSTGNILNVDGGVAAYPR